MSELPQNRSTSVTYGAEHLAPELIQRHFPHRFEEVLPAIVAAHYEVEALLGREQMRLLPPEVPRQDDQPWTHTPTPAPRRGGCPGPDHPYPIAPGSRRRPPHPVRFALTSWSDRPRSDPAVVGHGTMRGETSTASRRPMAHPWEDRGACADYARGASSN
jgi:hypothetical protein